MDIAHGSSRMNTDYCELLRSRSSGMYTLGEAPTARAKQVRKSVANLVPTSAEQTCLDYAECSRGSTKLISLNSC